MEDGDASRCRPKRVPGLVGLDTNDLSSLCSCVNELSAGSLNAHSLGESRRPFQLSEDTRRRRQNPSATNQLVCGACRDLCAHRTSLSVRSRV